MSNSTTNDFFKEQNEKSFVKSRIVVSFFETYFSIINNTSFSKDGIFYIDLFSGPGVYNDGTISTPIQILNTIAKLNTPDAYNKLKLVFNDENKEYADKLSTNLQNHKVYSKLKTKPIVFNKRTSDVRLENYTDTGCPIFSFIDPWGYKDVSFTQVNNLVQPVGSDCILFFNVNRILQDLNKPTSASYMGEIFGENLSVAYKVANDQSMSQIRKGECFVQLFSRNLYNAFFEELKAKKYSLFVLPFAFRQDLLNKTSHYILFITKNYKAITEMKRIMVSNSNSTSSALAFDEKDEYRLSLFTRQDNIYNEIRDLICDMLKKNKPLLNKNEKIHKWAEIIDRYSMKKNGIITPYTSNEIKEVIKLLDTQNYIKIASKINRTRITNETVFGFYPEIIGE